MLQIEPVDCSLPLQMTYCLIYFLENKSVDEMLWTIKKNKNKNKREYVSMSSLAGMCAPSFFMLSYVIRPNLLGLETWFLFCFFLFFILIFIEICYKKNT
jgi:hypothetical protein